MNPIERALAKADTITKANNALEAQSRPPVSMASQIASLKHGQSASFSLTGEDPVKVSYHSRQSYGDSGKKVVGATTGAYSVEYPGGRTSSHDHGPHASTETAARRGANPNAKPLTAHRVSAELVSHFSTQRMGFNDRRGTR